MLRVAKLLRQELWAKVNEALLGFLVMSHADDQSSGDKEYEHHWMDGLTKEHLEERTF